jgi:hypothetical protein
MSTSLSGNRSYLQALTGTQPQPAGLRKRKADLDVSISDEESNHSDQSSSKHSSKRSRNILLRRAQNVRVNHTKKKLLRRQMIRIRCMLAYPWHYSIFKCACRRTHGKGQRR